MKCCSTCKLSKSIDKFPKYKRAKDGYHNVCKECSNSKRREYYKSDRGKQKSREYREANKEKIREYTKNYMSENRAWVYKNKRKLEMCTYKGGSCTQCGVEATLDNIAMFDFHHLNPFAKEHTPSDLTIRKWETITKELDKCVLLCSNCHRVLHHRQYRAKLEELKTQEGVETIS